MLGFSWLFDIFYKFVNIIPICSFMVHWSSCVQCQVELIVCEETGYYVENFKL